MDSPFANKNSTFIVLYLEPYLNTYYKTYQNIITLSGRPIGPLSDFVTTLAYPKLSPFQESGQMLSPNSTCLHGLIRYPVNNNSNYNSTVKNSDYFLGSDDIPNLFSFLVDNGYSIESDLTKMLYKSPVSIGGISEKRFSGNRKMICMIKYNR